MKIISRNDLSNQIRERLAGATGVAVLGVGYELGSDDGVGLVVAQKVKECLPDVPVFLTGSAPENYTGPVVKAKPSHVIFVDAAELESAPGAIAVIDKDEIKGARFSTHTLPLSTIMEYFERSIGAKSFAVGIQPLQEGFGEEITPQVREAADFVANALTQAIGELGLSGRKQSN